MERKPIRGQVLIEALLLVLGLILFTSAIHTAATKSRADLRKHMWTQERKTRHE